jgi:hypothetical protein
LKNKEWTTLIQTPSTKLIGEMVHFFLPSKNIYIIHGAFLQLLMFNQPLDHDLWVAHLSTSNLFVVMQV